MFGYHVSETLSLLVDLSVDMIRAQREKWYWMVPTLGTVHTFVSRPTFLCLAVAGEFLRL